MKVITQTFFCKIFAKKLKWSCAATFYKKMHVFPEDVLGR